MSDESDAITSSTGETTAKQYFSGCGRVVLLGGGLALLVIATEPALADPVGSEFCDTNMAETIKNIFSIIQFGGPLLGGTLALGATVVVPYIRRADLKKQLKETRNQGVVWGVIVAPLATAIIQFILGTIVVGGTSCSF